MARWFGNEAFLNQYIMFADQINDSAKENDAIQRKQDIAASRVARNNALFRLLEQLPEEFAPCDVKKALKDAGMQPDGASTYLLRMEKREMIMKTSNGFKKLI